MLEARMIATGDFRISASGRKVRRLIKIGDDDYNKEKDIDKDGDIDADDEKKLKESIVEGTVQTKKYSWGTMKHVEHGHSFSIPLHPEHHQAIHKLKDGESHSFTDETKSRWKATREGDKVHFHGASRGNDGYKTSVSHESLKEEYQTTDKSWYQKPSTHLKGITAPAPVIHRIAVTVSEPDHPAVSKRNETKQKFVQVHHHTDNKEMAMERGKKHFAKKGFKVHGAEHVGIMHQEETMVEYSMDDLRKDAADHVKKSIDAASDKRIADLKNPPKKKGFFARVGEKQINMVKGAYHGLTKEETDMCNVCGQTPCNCTHISETADRTDARFIQLARLGLVEQNDLANLRLAMKTLSEDKQLTIRQRNLLLNVYESLISIVTGDDTIFSRMKIKVQEGATPEVDKSGSWKVETPWHKAEPDVKDKSGAVHTVQSRVRHLARLALKQQASKNKNEQ